jgi:glycosyltransferase involved in cell wall biosynthesis
MNQSKKILAVLKVPPPVTGATIMNAALVAEKNKWTRVQVDYCTVSYAENIQDLGSFRLKKILSFLQLFLSTIRYLATRPKSILYFQMSIFGVSFLRDSLILFGAKLFRRKRCVHLHGKGIKDYAEAHAWYRFWFRFLLKNQFAIVLTENQKRDIDWMEWDKIWVVPNGVDQNVKVKEWKKEAPLKWLFLSNLLLAKGIDDVLQLAILMKDQENWEGHIVGKEGDRNGEYIHQFILDNDLQHRLFYHGAVYGKEKWSRLEDADLFIFPTYNEAFGLVAIEAMSAGIPVIAYQEGGLTEIIQHDKTGFLVPKGDVLAIHEQIKKYMENHEVLVRHGDAGRQAFLSNFTMDCFIKNMNDVFYEMAQIKN